MMRVGLFLYELKDFLFSESEKNSTVGHPVGHTVWATQVHT